MHIDPESIFSVKYNKNMSMDTSLNKGVVVQRPYDMDTCQGLKNPIFSEPRWEN